MGNPFRLDNEIALITGGGTGIGLGMARCFAASGARVVLVGRREAELASSAKEIGQAASFLVHNITEVDRAEDLIARAEKSAGGVISILVNNAGIALKKSAVETSPAEFNSLLQTHVLAAHALTAAIAPAMIERKHGNILFIASMASLFGLPLSVAYAAAKSAHLGMVRTLAVELSPHGVRVNAIAPGWIDTGMWKKSRGADPKRQEKILARTPMGRYGTEEEVGWAAVYLCSPAASFVTGVVLPVDGGVSVGF